jgi:hypothetical protein
MDDEDAILSRRKLLIAGALSGAAFGIAGPSAFAQPQPMPCLSPPPSRPPASFSPLPGRRNTPIEQVPEAVRGHLEHGMIYAAGGGQTSTPWRIRVSQWGTMWAGESDEQGGRSFAPLAREWTTGVLNPTLSELFAIADRAWRERAPRPGSPTTSYGEVLAMREGNDVFFRDGYGPFRGGAPQELIARLREIANAARPR